MDYDFISCKALQSYQLAIILDTSPGPSVLTKMEIWGGG